MRKTSLEARRAELIKASGDLKWIGMYLYNKYKQKKIGNKLIRMGEKVMELQKELHTRIQKKRVDKLEKRIIKIERKAKKPCTQEKT